MIQVFGNEKRSYDGGYTYKKLAFHRVCNDKGNVVFAVVTPIDSEPQRKCIVMAKYDKEKS